MKHLIFFISILCFTNSIAQEPNPDLFQTWYLNFVVASDGSPVPYFVSEIDPTITPSLTIMEDLTFQGIGACNTFSGTFNLPFSDTLETNQFSTSTDDCGIEIHNAFEDEYFNFIQIISQYSISSIDNGLELHIITPVFGTGIFTNFILNTPSFDLTQIRIYPNPANSIIYLKSENSPILKIDLYNAFGQRIKSFQNINDTIDISNLSNGVYLIKVYSELGTINKKIIKT